MPKQISPCDRQGSLLNKTRQLLNNDPRSLFEIAVETGVPFDWLRKFAGNRVSGANVNRVQFLYEKLTGKKLFVSGK